MNSPAKLTIKQHLSPVHKIQRKLIKYKHY